MADIGTVEKRADKAEVENKAGLENKAGGGHSRERKSSATWVEILFLAVLVLYPLRHINLGLDLWDTGYSYANFRYMGLEHMDSMWLFSTYLANVAGHFLSGLPFADSLVGMNFYTGLFVSALAVVGYLFCTRTLHVPKGIAFLGELTAVSLCWCPTAVLYNYLTFALLLLCVILLYYGLTASKHWLLFAAGLCLGTNVLVRFSNLPEAALIVGVWAYGVIEHLEWKRDTRAEKNRDRRAEQKETESGLVRGEKSGALKRSFRRTLWCMGGYLAASGFWFGYLHIRYGLDNYAAGIQRLFDMTDKATDYKATSMVAALLHQYVSNLYWVARIGVIAVCGLIFFGAAVKAEEFQGRGKGHGDVRGKSGKMSRKVSLLMWTVRGIWCLVCAAMIYWLHMRGFCVRQFADAGASVILRPGILFLLLTMGIGVLRIFHRDSPKEEKLISGLIILVIVIASIGSNNHVFPSINNLFLAGPYTLWQCWRFVRCGKDGKLWKFPICTFPVKGVLCAFLALFLALSFRFGASFVFAEAKGVTETTARVENNPVLKGVKMSPERAEWMTQISAYAAEQGFAGREVILYGKIPALSYYLQMPSAFNPWSDLASYSLTTMEQALLEVEEEMRADASYRPVILLEKEYGLYGEAVSAGELRHQDISRERWEAMEQDGKWQLILDFMETHEYKKCFSNEKFSIWE